jgi:NAD(P)-dependent dehydrogenase (short-subunit alcohol dehydrogenase family)
MQRADQVAIITGAARGIGLATAWYLAEEGAYIVLADINGAGAQEAAAEIESRGVASKGGLTGNFSGST